MANRHLSRSIVLQALFGWDFRGMEKDSADIILEHNIEEYAPGMKDSAFMQDLMKNIIDGRQIDLSDCPMTDEQFDEVMKRIAVIGTAIERKLPHALTVK